MFRLPVGREAKLRQSSLREAHHKAFGLKLEFPSLGRKILPKAVMLFFAYDLKPCLFVDMSRRVEDALRPQCHLLIACLTGEADAFRHESLPNPEPPSCPFNVQQPQLCNFL